MKADDVSRDTVHNDSPGLLPPHVAFLCLALIGLLRLILGRMFFPPAFVAAGVLVIGVGAFLIIWAALLFRNARTPVRPFREVAALVTDGPYQFTRNPMYCGLVLILVGTSLGLQQPAGLLVAAGFAMYLTEHYIKHEEHILRERFAEAYDSFCTSSPRWL
ncbi:MAG: isoprenylcysteine carboxylmethyltransferase family protein [Bdellovibrionales bacterium]|nr:isoprenylcysteine carboxylmethyltransferase family protein [Bdellovibrionales bacterium]